MKISVSLLLVLSIYLLTCEAFLVSSRQPARRARHLFLASTGSVVDQARQRIEEALSPSELVVKSSDEDPNGSHVALKVVGDVFRGKTRVARHQLVYKALWQLMDPAQQGAIHAVDQLICQTPEEAAAE